MTQAHLGLVDPRAYVRLAAMVRGQIADGTLGPGRPAPSITRLSQEHGHARPTCGKALRLLEREGLLTRVPGLIILFCSQRHHGPAHEPGVIGSRCA